MVSKAVDMWSNTNAGHAGHPNEWRAKYEIKPSSRMANPVLTAILVVSPTVEMSQ